MPEASFDSGSPADSFETAGRTEVFLSIGNFGCEKIGRQYIVGLQI